MTSISPVHAATMAAIALLTILAAAPPRKAAAQVRWPDERVAGTFVCHADFSLAPYESLLAEMSQLQHDLTTHLGVRESGEPIHVFWFRRKSTYQNYIKHYFPQVPYRRALFIKGRGPGMVFAYQNREFTIDVRHEGTHALLHAALPMVPLWLDEGLAEYYELPPQQRAFDSPHLAATKWKVRLGWVPPISELENIGELSDMGQGEYRDSWAWVHFMLHGSPHAHDELVRFLADIEANTPPGKLSERLRRRVPDLEQQFVDHFRNWSR